MEHTLDPHSVLCICSKLKASEILTTGATCSTLASLTRANFLWQPLLQQDFGLYIQATGSQGVDLQNTYRQLATAHPSHALRFAAVFTDGGCDGMPDDLTYWADHAFQPNHYSPHCSDAKQDINIVAVLQPKGCDVDVQLSEHRQYLVERCAPAAALLFGPTGVAVAHPSQSIPQAAASLAGWSSLGLERLFVDLYQDLVLHQDQSTWGKLLLQDVPVNQVQEELQRLHAAAQRIEVRQGRGLYNTVQQVPPIAVAAAASTARAASACGAKLTLQEYKRELGSLQQLPHGSSKTCSSHHAAVADGTLQLSQSTAAVGAAAAESNLPVGVQLNTAAIDDAAAAAEPSAKEAARHMYDSQQLQWFSEPSSAKITALVREVVISRVGHFTCPLAAGALLLGQHPAAATAAAASHLATSGVDSSSSPELQQMLAIKHDPLVILMNGLTSLDQVQSAVAAGQLPQLLQREEAPGVEWVEFAPLRAEQREARAKQGWYMRPVVWFRFSTPPRVASPTHADAQPGAAAAAAPAVANDGGDAEDNAMVDAAAADPGPAVVEESSQEAAQPDSTAGAMEDTSADEGTSEFEHQRDSSAAEGMRGADTTEEAFTSPSNSPTSSSHISSGGGGGGRESDLDMESGSEDPGDSDATVDHSDDSDDVFLDADAEMAEELLAVAQLEGAAVDPMGGMHVTDMQIPQVLQAIAHSDQQEAQQQQQNSSTGGSSSGFSVDRPWPNSVFSLLHGKPALSVAAPPSGLRELLPGEASVLKHLLLRMPLQVAHSGNVAVLKLISSEDKMDEYDDPSEDPNIDIQCISLRGIAVQVEADGVMLL